MPWMGTCGGFEEFERGNWGIRHSCLGQSQPQFRWLPLCRQQRTTLWKSRFVPYSGRKPSTLGSLTSEVTKTKTRRSPIICLPKESVSLNSENLPQGLYLETLEFTELAKRKKRLRSTSFGHDFIQKDDEYSLFIGVDSKFPERRPFNSGTFPSIFLSLTDVSSCRPTDWLMMPKRSFPSSFIRRKVRVLIRGPWSMRVVTMEKGISNSSSSIVISTEWKTCTTNKWMKTQSWKYLEYEKSYPDRFEDSDSQSDGSPVSEEIRAAEFGFAINDLPSSEGTKQTGKALLLRDCRTRSQGGLEVPRLVRLLPDR